MCILVETEVCLEILYLLTSQRLYGILVVRERNGRTPGERWLVDVHRVDGQVDTLILGLTCVDDHGFVT